MKWLYLSGWSSFDLGPKLRNHFQNHQRFKKRRYRGIGSRKCSFPAKWVGIFDDETFTEVRKWWGSRFAWKNRDWDGFSRRKPPLSWLRELTVEILVCCISRNARNGKLRTKTHKNKPEVSHFYSFYWVNVKLSVFLGFIIDRFLFPIQSLITRLNSQRLPVTQYRLHSKVVFPLVINYYTLSSDANLGCLWKDKLYWITNEGTMIYQRDCAVVSFVLHLIN